LCLETVVLKYLSDFQKGQNVDARLAAASVTKTVTISGVPTAAVSKVMTAYINHGKTRHQLREIVAKNNN
jgi:hypothetical protein